MWFSELYVTGFDMCSFAWMTRLPPLVYDPTTRPSWLTVKLSSVPAADC
jgi:hypothetical protein